MWENAIWWGLGIFKSNWCSWGQCFRPMYLGCHLHFPCVRVPLLSRWKNFPEMIWQLVHYQNLFTSSTSKCSKQCGYNSFLTKRCVEPGETYHIQFSNWDPDASPMMPQAKQRKKNSVIPYQENRLFRISYLREAFLGLIPTCPRQTKHCRGTPWGAPCTQALTTPLVSSSDAKSMSFIHLKRTNKKHEKYWTRFSARIDDKEDWV